MQNVVNNTLIIKLASWKFKGSPHNCTLERNFGELHDRHLVLSYTLNLKHPTKTYCMWYVTVYVIVMWLWSSQEKTKQGTFVRGEREEGDEGKLPEGIVCPILIPRILHKLN